MSRKLAHGSGNSRTRKVRHKKWDTIEIPTIDELEEMSPHEIQAASLPSDFCIRFFCHDMDHLFTVASNQVKITRGVLDYLHDYNQLGPNKSRNKLFVCSQFNRSKECLNGWMCREVHCVLNVEDAEDALTYQVPSNATGAPNVVKLASAEDIIAKKRNEPLSSGSVSSGLLYLEDSNPLKSTCRSTESAVIMPSIYMPEGRLLRHSLHTRWTSVKKYPTLPGGLEFKIALPNTPTPVDSYDSSLLLATRGAQEYYIQCMRNEQPTVTMQHCAHYSKNGVCCFGEDCQFVHVVHYAASERQDSCTSDADASSMCSTPSITDTERRRSARLHSGRSGQNPLNVSAICGNTTCDSLASSRSASSNRSATTPHQKFSPLMSGSSAASTSNKCILVPPAHAWSPNGGISGGVTPSQLQLSSPHFAQESLRMPSMPSPSVPLMGQPYMLMHSIDGHCYIVPQAPSAMTPLAQSAPTQPMYAMPIPFQ